MEEAGYDVIQAAAGGQALQLLQDGIAVDALLTDIRLPGVTGWDVAKAYRERFPSLPVLYLTDYAEKTEPISGGVIVGQRHKLRNAEIRLARYERRCRIVLAMLLAINKAADEGAVEPILTAVVARLVHHLAPAMSWIERQSIIDLLALW